MDTSVVYYSLSGSTRAAAEAIAKKNGAKLYELIEVKGNRKGVWGFIKSGYQASTRKKTALVSTLPEAVQNCTRIYIGTPVWAGMPTPAVNAFIDANDFTGKEVCLFSVQADPETEKMSQKLFAYLSEIIKAKGGQMAGVFALQGAYKQSRTEDEIRKEATTKVI
jgi:flavodoxin